MLCACALISCGEQHSNSSDSKTDVTTLSKQEIPNCVLDVEARQIKKCSPDITEDYTGFSGLLMIDAIRPDRQWMPTTGIELVSPDQNNVIRMTFTVRKWATDENGMEVVSKTPFIGSIEKWKHKELQWRKEVEATIQPAQPFTFSIHWQQQKELQIALDEETITIDNIGFDISQFSIYGSGVRVATSDFGILH
ncbi:hypothetical protein TDB9533_03131 [Thalassocella blandensis]|nr:hypothetical protein TDB9533_03131 [Thalassocella blandensis]